MALFCCGIACEYPFRQFNDMFKAGVPDEIAELVSTDYLQADDSDPCYGMDVSGFDADDIQCFEKNWLGRGADAWFGSEAGECIYSAFVAAMQAAGSRQVKAIWVESSSTAVQTIEDDQLVLLVVGSPRPEKGAHGGGNCGETLS